MSLPRVETINSLSALENWITQISSSSSFSTRQNSIKSWETIGDQAWYQTLSKSKAVKIMSKWIRDYHEILKSGQKWSSDEEDFIRDMLSVLDKCNLSYNEITKTKIGKNLNKLEKDISSSSWIKSPLNKTLSVWKQIILQKDKDSSHDSKSKDDPNYITRKTKREKEANFDSSSFNYSTNLSNNNFNKNNLSNYRRGTNKNNNSNILPSQTNKKPKSCVKASTTKSSKKVRFEAEEQIEKVKIFKMTDQPNAPNITDEEYQKIQKEVALNPHIFKLDDIRTKEIKMDQPRLPQVQWREPLKWSIESSVVKGKDSWENTVIDELCQKMLSVNYYKTYKTIPEPKKGESQLFSFTDDNIPKIENRKIANHTNVCTIKDVLVYIDSLQNKEITEEILKEISEKLSNIDEVSQEKKNEIISDLALKIKKVEGDSKLQSQGKDQYMNQQVIHGHNQQNMLRPQISVGMPYPYFPAMAIGNISKIPAINNPWIDRKQFIESASKMDLEKYKTKQCRNYHSVVGCTRGVNCFFIHDPKYQGVDIPNFNYLNYNLSMSTITKPLPLYLSSGAKRQGSVLEGKEDGEIIWKQSQSSTNPGVNQSQAFISNQMPINQTMNYMNPMMSMNMRGPMMPMNMMNHMGGMGMMYNPQLMMYMQRQTMMNNSNASKLPQSGNNGKESTNNIITNLNNLNHENSNNNSSIN